jgi:CRISPR system Cascade subunit CasA
MFNLLFDQIIRCRMDDGSLYSLSLPDLYDAFAADKVVSLPALRPHQRHPWHAFVCQLGAVACINARIDSPAVTQGQWRNLFSSLTSDFPNCEPWQLVSPLDRPAFLQPVCGTLAELRQTETTPDAIDMLVTAKNHDLKAERIKLPQPDDWFFALIALQTAEGFLGAGNFGISRMNGGFANRPSVSLAPPGGPGAQIFRDIGRLIDMFEEILERHLEYDADGPALLWLLPFDGKTSLPRRGLHPYYIEICRRLRLARGEDGGIIAHRAPSKVARIAMSKVEGGITGDPWAPLIHGDPPKVLTTDAGGFHYRRLSAIITARGYERAPLQKFGSDEGGSGWSLVCRALTRGQGRTEGYHERRIPLPPEARRLLGSAGLPRLETISRQRVEQAGAVRTALRRSLMVLFQNGADTIKFDHEPSARKAEPFLTRFNELVDGDFFEHLFLEARKEDETQSIAVRRVWLLALLRRAEKVLGQASVTTPASSVRRHRARVRAGETLRRGFYSSDDLKHYVGKAENG